MHKLNLICTSFDIYSACVKILCMCMQQRTYRTFRCHVRATLKVADFSLLFPGGHCQHMFCDIGFEGEYCPGTLDYVCQANIEAYILVINHNRPAKWLLKYRKVLPAKADNTQWYFEGAQQDKWQFELSKHWKTLSKNSRCSLIFDFFFLKPRFDKRKRSWLSDGPPHGMGACNHPESLFGVCTLIKQGNGLCGPRRGGGVKKKNERKGELNYRLGWLHKSCISCFMACQKNSTPVDRCICNCAWAHLGGWRAESRRYVSEKTKKQKTSCLHFFFFGLIAF